MMTILDNKDDISDKTIFDDEDDFNDDISDKTMIFLTR